MFGGYSLRKECFKTHRVPACTRNIYKKRVFGVVFQIRPVA